MFDETSRSHTDDDSTRHIHRLHRPQPLPQHDAGHRHFLWELVTRLIELGVAG